MNALAMAPVEPPSALLELGQSGLAAGSWFKEPMTIDLAKLLAGRLLVQGSSGAGKSWLLRKIVEEAFEYATVMIVDPEGEFGNLAVHIGATTLKAAELSVDGLTAAAARGRQHRLPLHLDLTDLESDERVIKAAAFFAGLLSAPREHWAHTILVAIDEAHLLAPNVAASARDRETRQLGVATLTELCSRGRKRGIAPIIATQRLAKLAASVTSELQNSLIGLSVFDRDIARAAERLGFDRTKADELRDLAPGTFYAIGPAMSRRALLCKVGETATQHLGVTPELLGPAEMGSEEALQLLDLGGLQEVGSAPAIAGNGKGRGALDGFLMHPLASPAARVIESLRTISPNATTSADLCAHLALPAETIDGALDLLSGLAAVDTMPRGEGRMARLGGRLRLRVQDIAVVGLS